MISVKYWEIIADNLKKAGWSLGYVQNFIGVHNETLSVTVCVRNPDCSPFTIHGCNCVYGT
jgi:hypothetical protein